jgi:rubredoxin
MIILEELRKKTLSYGVGLSSHSIVTLADIEAVFAKYKCENCQHIRIATPNSVCANAVSSCYARDISLNFFCPEIKLKEK